MTLRIATLAALAALAWLGPRPAVATAPPDDPYLWLEEVEGTRALDWVRAENAKTVGVLEQDPRYAALYAEALAIVEAKDRLPMPEFRGGAIYNFWQDAEHVRGVWRRTTLADYGHAVPRWETVLDLDRVAADEHANWVWQDAECLRPQDRHCLLGLSDGGEDANTRREFDLGKGAFVTGGFELPKAKQNVAWYGPDEIYVAREFGPGTLTKSGYPFVVKALRRGTALADAREVFRGKDSDVYVAPTALVDGSGQRALLIMRAVTFFEFEWYLAGTAAPRRLALPLKSESRGLVAGRLLFLLNEPWTAGGRTFPAGALVSVALDAARRDPGHLRPSLVFAPGPRESLGDVEATRSRLVITSFANVRGRAAVYSPTANGGWRARPLALPDMASIDVVSADLGSDTAFLAVRGFLAPTTLWQLDAASGLLANVRSLPPKFDARGLVVEQFEATSSDGTHVPYFVVHRAAQPADGSNPTILYAYGGFQVAETPNYSGTLGKLWLERGGTYVLANIRGGGEFGPAWHEAGLKTHRQRIYDDFAAVARDLIRRGITSPRRLGIEGGSNGGLLMGVEFTQHPELWRAVDIQVPLLDMLRFEQIAAGPSWVGEYGSVSVPQEREFLASISPYHQLKHGVEYPLPLVWTTTKDDRVGPQHARKFAARLAELGVPYLYYEVIEGGHASGANLKERAHTTALEMTYFTRRLMD
ncbi:MAG: S9 family peptidase [Proteobacteria bacterium]|nr:S9 family peptidase [Pseudomonadota bacterium]